VEREAPGGLIAAPRLNQFIREVENRAVSDRLCSIILHRTNLARATPQECNQYHHTIEDVVEWEIGIIWTVAADNEALGDRIKITRTMESKAWCFSIRRKRQLCSQRPILCTQAG